MKNEKWKMFLKFPCSGDGSLLDAPLDLHVIAI